MGKKGLQVTKDEYLYTLEIDQKESMKKKFLNVAYFVLSKFTDKYLETIVVTVTVK